MKNIVLLALSSTAAAAAHVQCNVAEFDEVLPANSTTLYAIQVPQDRTFWVAEDVAYPSNATNLPELCAVAFNVTSSPSSSFTFGMFLPEKWNSRLYTAGNGGFLGGINWLQMAEGLEEGAACASTDAGHNATSSNDAAWAYHAPEAIKDWAGRSLHSTVIQAKAIVSTYYGSRAEYSYFSGCSTGGYQGLKEVQAYMDDFDGVLVGSPAWWHSHLQTWSIQVALWNQPPDAPYHIPDSLFPIIGEEVMRQCDRADSVADGIISAPARCDFHPEALLCTPKTSNKSTCLTPPQIGLLDKIYSSWYEANNTSVFPQYTYGSEFQWSLLSTGANDDQFSEAFAKYIMLQNPNWTVANFSYQTVLEEEQLCREMGLDADNFDLSRFHRRGGKLLHYVGLADGLIPPGSSKYYYNHVGRTMEPEGVHVPDFYRLFPIPGMGHCSGTRPGGSAPWYINGAGQAGDLGQGVRGVPGYQDADHDALRALMRWVEGGVAPRQITATKYKNDHVDEGVTQQRPICMYPGMAVFRGGDMTEARNWVCQES